MPSLPRCRVVPLPQHQVSFQIDGRERLRWHHGKEYPRPFFHPLIGPGGAALTRMGHPGAPNHDHHRSIWFAHNKVLGIDFWSDDTAARIDQHMWLVYDGELPPHRIDPSTWETGGPVLLMNLDQTSDWQTSAARESFRLLLSDRWDVYAPLYAQYASVCRDLDEVRSDSYLRTDGSWGGYKRWVTAAAPALLVTDSANPARIRRMSLGPQWSLLGIDARRTVFGLNDKPLNRRQAQRCIGTLYRLEWPGIEPVSLDGSVIAATRASEKRRVAEVLCAARFPYAALRLLPRDAKQATQSVETWCYVELAHRMRRHSGCGSLLDQSRAVFRLRLGRENGDWAPQDSLRIALSLEGLGLYDLASSFARDVLDSRFPGGMLPIL